MTPYTLLLLVVAGWLFIDLKALGQWQATVARMHAEGRVDELPAELERGLNTWRPFILLARWLLLRGVVEAQCGLSFQQMGMHARCVSCADLAIRRAPPSSRTLAAAHAVRALGLLSLGRYDEAKADMARVRAMTAADGALLVGEVNLHLAQCRFTRALEVAKEVLVKKPLDEPAHICGASALLGLGRFDEALAFLEHDPRPMSKIYSPTELEAMQSTDTSRELLAAQEQARAAVVKPSPSIMAAQVLVEKGEPVAARAMLERARAVLGGNLIVNFHFHATLARALAMEGDDDGAQRSLSAACELAAKLPDARGLVIEARVAKARCFNALRKFEAALDELRSAESIAMHASEWSPLLHHEALAFDGLGRVSDATQARKRLIETVPEGWMREDALRKLTV